MASASPPVRYPNVYGVDMPTAKEFVAYNLSEEQICEVLGADGLVYQSQQDLLDVGRDLNPDIVEFEASCFTGAGGVGVIVYECTRASIQAAMCTQRSTRTTCVRWKRRGVARLARG